MCCVVLDYKLRMYISRMANATKQLSASAYLPAL